MGVGYWAAGDAECVADCVVGGVDSGPCWA